MAICDGGTHSGVARYGIAVYRVMLPFLSKKHLLPSEAFGLNKSSPSGPVASAAAKARLGGNLIQREARPVSLAENRARSAFLGLLAMQDALLKGYFRLAGAERTLFEHTHGNRSGIGRHTARQLELERRRLGRELHTGIGQSLAAIRLQIELIAAHLPTPDAPVGQALDNISKLAGEALGQVRSLSHRLHPPEWQRLGLGEALRQLWEICGISQSFQGELRIAPLLAEPEL